MDKKVMELLVEIRPEFEADFADSQDFVEDGLLDSFDIVTLINMVEEELGVTIDGLDIVPENFKNLNAIIELVQRSK